MYDKSNPKYQQFQQITNSTNCTFKHTTGTALRFQRLDSPVLSTYM